VLVGSPILETTSAKIYFAKGFNMPLIEAQKPQIPELFFYLPCAAFSSETPQLLSYLICAAFSTKTSFNFHEPVSSPNCQ
jgi:hypothetical protein